VEDVGASGIVPGRGPREMLSCTQPRAFRSSAWWWCIARTIRRVTGEARLADCHSGSHFGDFPVSNIHRGESGRILSSAVICSIIRFMRHYSSGLHLRRSLIHSSCMTLTELLIEEVQRTRAAR
jgi:hypothetical protein